MVSSFASVQETYRERTYLCIAGIKPDRKQALSIETPYRKEQHCLVTIKLLRCLAQATQCEAFRRPLKSVRKKYDFDNVAD